MTARETMAVVAMVLSPVAACGVVHYAAGFKVLDEAIRYAVWCFAVFAEAAR